MLMMGGLQQVLLCAVAALPFWASQASAQSSNGSACASSGTAPIYQATKKYLGCYLDPRVSILNSAKLSTVAMTPQFCANWCGEQGFKYGGVNFGTQCFCGANPSFNNANKTDDSRCNQMCVTEPTSACGATYVMSLYEIENPKTTTGARNTLRHPACQTYPLCSHKVCDKSLSIRERVAALVKDLTLEEKILNIVDGSAGAARLGLPSHEWWNEATHGVGSAPGVLFPGTGPEFNYATSFPSPITSAASFDDELFRLIGEVVGKESRAFANNGFSGFNFWTPNMNAFRDPRWGRGQETPGEDIFHIQSYIKNYVPALQGSNIVDKQVIATCKHYAAYDLETGRYGNNYNPTPQDLTDYYLAPFKTCVRDANVGSIMCSYNAVNGIPSCANEYLLEDVLRKHWNFTADYHYVVGDCGAVNNVWKPHNFTNTEASAAAVALNAGTDMDCGSSFIKLSEALKLNQTTVGAVDRAVTRLFSALFTVGFFEPSKYSSLAFADVATPSAQKLAYRAAVEGLTLLKNDGLLPLGLNSTYKKVAVIGPFANATTQMQGDYSGKAKYLNSPLQAFQSQFTVEYAEGTAINTRSSDGFASALSAAAKSDIIVYFGGIDNSLENEERDRTSLAWPGNQLDLITQLAKAGKPVIVVQFGGGQVDDSDILANKNISALLWAGYPSQDGGPAIRDVLLGKESVAGRLPTTQYPKSYADEVSIFNINLRPNGSYPGRTYQWYTGKPVFPFGFGLHYTDFKFAWGKTLQPEYSIQNLTAQYRSNGLYNNNAPFATLTASVDNVGKHASDFVGLLFISSRNAGPAPRPNKTLVSYLRLHDIAVNSKKELSFPLTLSSLARSDEDGNLSVYPGDYTLSLDVDQKIQFNFTLRGEKVVIDTLPLPKQTYNFTVPVHPQPASTEAHS